MANSEIKDRIYEMLTEQNDLGLPVTQAWEVIIYDWVDLTNEERELYANSIFDEVLEEWKSSNL